MLRRVCVLLALAWCADTAQAISIEAPFDSHYAFADLGEPPGNLGNLGGLSFLPGNTDAVLMGGHAAGPFGAIYSVGVVRNADGHITGFAGTPTEIAKASGITGGIDGGLAVGPDGVLFYTTYRDNQLGQIRPGSTAPDRLIDLGALGVRRSTGSLQFVPSDMPGGGRLKLLSVSASTWYDATVAPAGDGTFDIVLGDVARLIGGGPEGVVCIRAGNPGFERDSILVSEWSNKRVTAYEIDANGDPIVDTRRVFITGLSSAQGATVDPLTGDFLFSNYAGEDRGVIVVGGFAPPPQPVPLPAAWLLMGTACAIVGGSAGRRRSC